MERTLNQKWKSPMSAKDRQKEFIKNYLKPTLKNWGYQTGGQTWWKDRGDFFTVICLQNSSWNCKDDVSFWFDIGIALKDTLKDPAKKKVGWKDLLFRNFDETAFLSKKKKSQI